MMKKLLLAMALGSLVWLVGCAKGGSGPCVSNCPEIDVTGSNGSATNLSVAGVSLPLTFTATIKNAAQGPVTWNITGTNCTNPTDSSNPCGYFTATTGSTASYQGPSSIPATPQFEVVATLQSDPGLSGSLTVTIVPDTANVSPAAPDVAAGLTQEYVATAAPDYAPQTFTWTCTVNGSACANFVQDPDISGLARYKPTAGEECGGSGCVTISAAATIDPTGCSYDTKKFPCQQSQTTVISQRLSGVYAFQFSGYDANGKAIAVAGTFTVAAGGAISGFEDENSWNGSAFVTTQHNFSGGSYTPLGGGNDNSNNAGTLSLNTGVFPSTYTAVLDGNGDVQMIASSGGASGSGFAVLSAVNKFNQGTTAVFAFGLTGVDASNNRVGYVGLLATDGVSSVTTGQIDINDNGSASGCISPNCAVTGSYTFNSGTNRGQLTLTAPKVMAFDFFVANGNSSNPNNPLNLYAISTDSNPTVVGTMTLQDSKVSPYNNAAFNGTSVSELVGANNNVALIQGTTLGDSKSSGGQGPCSSNNNNLGNVEGTFNQNNGGTLIPPPPLSLTGIGISFPNNTSESGSSNPYTYVSTSGNTGRYIFCLLGNPTDTSPVMPIPFVLYASGANRGYLLDQSSSSVMTGTMNPETTPKSGAFASIQAAGTYAVATSSNTMQSASGCNDLASCYASMNLLLTSPSSTVFSLSGIENPGNTAISGTYTVTFSGLGALTMPGQNQSNANFVIYGVTETSFYMIGWDEESGTTYNGLISPMLYMVQ